MSLPRGDHPPEVRDWVKRRLITDATKQQSVTVVHTCPRLCVSRSAFFYFVKFNSLEHFRIISLGGTFIKLEWRKYHAAGARKGSKGTAIGTSLQNHALSQNKQVTDVNSAR